MFDIYTIFAFLEQLRKNEKCFNDFFINLGKIKSKILFNKDFLDKLDKASEILKTKSEYEKKLNSFIAFIRADEFKDAENENIPFLTEKFIEDLKFIKSIIQEILNEKYQFLNNEECDLIKKFDIDIDDMINKAQEISKGIDNFKKNQEDKDIEQQYIKIHTESSESKAELLASKNQTKNKLYTSAKFKALTISVVSGALLGAGISATLALKAFIPLAALSCIPIVGQTIAAGGLVGIATFIAVSAVVGAIAGAITGSAIFSCNNPRSKEVINASNYNTAGTISHTLERKVKNKEQEIAHVIPAVC